MYFMVCAPFDSVVRMENAFMVESEQIWRSRHRSGSFFRSAKKSSRAPRLHATMGLGWGIAMAEQGAMVTTLQDSKTPKSLAA
jgi:hypothetical protein